MIAWVMARVLAAVLPRRFRPGGAGGLEAELEFRIRPFGRRPAVPVAVRIARGRCEARPAAALAPGVVATLALDDLVRVGAGRVGWPELLSAGRLTMTGDPFLALRVPTLFGLPVRASS